MTAYNLGGQLIHTA